MVMTGCLNTELRSTVPEVHAKRCERRRLIITRRLAEESAPALRSRISSSAGADVIVTLPLMKHSERRAPTASDEDEDGYAAQEQQQRVWLRNGGDLRRNAAEHEVVHRGPSREVDRSACRKAYRKEL